MQRNTHLAGLIDFEDSVAAAVSAACLTPTPPHHREHGAQQRGTRTFEEARVTRDPINTTLPPAWDTTLDDLEQGPTTPRPGPVGQWRPTTNTTIQRIGHQEIEQQQINSAVLASLQALTQQLTLAEEARQPAAPDFTFSGADVEDPEGFIVRMERYFREKRIYEENRVTVARKALRGDARRWAESVSVHDIPWSLFVAQFVAKYSAPANVAQLMRQLYGVTQGPTEDPMTFVTRKFQLFQRVAPLTPERQQVQVIQELLSPWYRPAVRQAACQNVAQLMETVQQTHSDLQEQQDVPHPAGLRFYRGEQPARHAAPAQPARNMALAPPTQQGNQQRNQQEQRQQRNAEPVPPYPCRHCGGDHFNNRCPTLARSSGNGPPAVQLGRGRAAQTPAEATTRGPTPAPRNTTSGR